MPRLLEKTPTKTLLEKGKIYSNIGRYDVFELNGKKYEIYDIDIEDDCLCNFGIRELNEVPNPNYNNELRRFLAIKEKYDKEMAEWNEGKKIQDAKQAEKNKIAQEKQEKEILKRLKQKYENQS